MIPQPTAQQALPDETFSLQSDATIGLDAPTARTTAERFAAQLRRSTGFALPIQDGSGTITLSTAGPESLGAEGYELRAAASGVTITAATAEGLFRGVTSLRQLLPAKAEAGSPQDGPWEIAGTTISDSRGTATAA